MISKDYPTVGKLYRNRGRPFACDRGALDADDCVLVLAYNEESSQRDKDRGEVEVTMLITKLGIVAVGSYMFMAYSSVHWSFWWEEVE